MKATKIFLVSVFALLFFVGCEENSIIMESNFSNGPSNLMPEDIGILHNKFLDTVYNYYNINSITNDTLLIFEEIKNLMKSFYYYEIDTDTSGMGNYLDSIQFPIQYNTLNEVANAYNFSSLSIDILTIVDTLIIDLANEDITLNTFKDEIDSLYINQCPMIVDSTERIQIQTTLQVSKYSAIYWEDSENDKWSNLELNEESIYQIRQNKLNMIQRPSKQQKQEVLAADAVGAIEGAIRGGIIGSWLGPWGAVAGAMLGAMCDGGAASASTRMIQVTLEKVNN